MDIMKITPFQIRKLVKRYGTQERLARELNVSVFTVGKWVNGKVKKRHVAMEERILALMDGGKDDKPI